MNDEELHDLLRLRGSGTAPAFAPGFADRVMHGVRERKTTAFDVALVRQARRVLPALAAASMLLAAWNYVSLRDRAPSAFGAVLGVAKGSATTNTDSYSATALVNVEVFE